MNKTKLIAALLGSAILCASLLTGCGSPIKLKESGGMCVSSSGDVTYRHASTCFVPVSLGDECGTLEVSSHLSVALYEIKDMDPDEWLATEDGYVLYADGVTLPTLSEMQPVAVHIYNNSGVLLSRSAEITDSAKISRLTEACTKKADVSLTSASSYVVQFKSDIYPGLYYSLFYIEQGEGYYLYDRFSGTVFAIDSVVRDALNGADTEAADVTAGETAAA